MHHVATRIGGGLLVLSAGIPGMAWADEVPPTVRAIIEEAVKPGYGEGGHPLPLASSWDSGMGAWGLTGYPNYLPREEVNGKLSLQFQRDLLLAGHHWLPVSQFPTQALTRAQDPDGSPWFNFQAHFEPWDTFAAWGVPFTWMQTQFDAPIYNQAHTTDRWVKLPPSLNPNVISADHPMYSGTLAATAIATTSATHTVQVDLPDATGIDTQHRLWITQPIEVGGLHMTDERWQVTGVEKIHCPLTGVEGTRVFFSHPQPATATATGGGVAFETAVVHSVADPLGPKIPWREAGTWWMTEFAGATDAVNGWRNLQRRYPQPPRLIFLTNNEGRLLPAERRHTSRRFVDTHGGETTFFDGQEVFARGFSDRFTTLIAGMRDSMPPAWAETSKMVAYNAVFTWNYARFGGWWNHSSYFPDNIDFEKNTWDGASPEYYLNPWQGDPTPVTDYTVFSPQVEFMHVKWQLDRVRETHPDFWYEMSVWDGFQPNTPEPGKNKRAWYASKNDPFTPARYKAWLQYGMWLTRPRVVREFRNTGSPLDETGRDYFFAMLEAVDDVHVDPVKVRFWRHGRVVANTSRQHPYRQNTRDEYDGIDKWFNLNTDIDPPGSWGLTTEIPVWALALVIGEAPRREWLVYCYSPRRDRFDVAITLPDYGDVVVDIPQAGAFHHVVEKPNDAR